MNNPGQAIEVSATRG